MPTGNTGSSAPLVFVAAALDDDLRFCLRQARFADPDRPLLLITADTATPPEGIVVLAPTELGMPATADEPTIPRLLAILAACCRLQNADACWYLAVHTLLFDALAWPESHLRDTDLAAAQGPTGEVLALYAKAGSLLDLRIAPVASLQQAADALGLSYEPLDEIRMGHTFCMGLGNVQGFRMAAGGALKHIVWVKGQPFFVSTQTGLVARAITLHLPGTLAGRLHRYYTGPGMMLQKLKAEGKLLF